MPTFEVPDADIWVGEAPPTGADPLDFWFDTSKVPLFGIDIKGSLPNPGPPAEPSPSPGDAWWDSNGNLWVWSAPEWVDQGNFRGPPGPTGPSGGGGVLPPGGDTDDVLVKSSPAANDAHWRPLEQSDVIAGLEQRIRNLELQVSAMAQTLESWSLTANWSPEADAQSR